MKRKEKSKNDNGIEVNKKRMNEENEGIMKKWLWKGNNENEWMSMRKKKNVIEKGFELKNEESEWMGKED